MGIESGQLGSRRSKPGNAKGAAGLQRKERGRCRGGRSRPRGEVGALCLSSLSLRYNHMGQESFSSPFLWSLSGRGINLCMFYSTHTHTPLETAQGNSSAPSLCNGAPWK